MVHSAWEEISTSPNIKGERYRDEHITNEMRKFSEVIEGLQLCDIPL